MKIRRIKLKEAHKTSSPTYCCLLWEQQANNIVTSCCSDTCIRVHDRILLSANPKVLNNHRDGVTVLSISPNSTSLASGSLDHTVKLYKFPGGEFETNITRFTLPIRALAFNKSGSMLAAAGDDDGIKLINTVDGSIARVLKGHKGSITGLAFDPKNEYLASIDSVGTVIYWELQSGGELHTLKGVAPDSGLDSSIINIICWSPDGETLAVPGLRNEVVMYDRDTAEKLFSLRGDHVERISFMCWSPNGKYMATSGLDRQVLIWDVAKKMDIDRQKFDDVICCMAWKPTGNALAVVDTRGKYGIWDSAVPSSMKSPTKDIPSLQSKNSNGILFDDDGWEEDDPDLTASLNDVGEDSLGESEPPSRKRLRKQSAYDDEFGEDMDDEEDLFTRAKSRSKPSHDHKEQLEKGKDVVKSTVVSNGPTMQDAFQPGCTPLQPGKRRFLFYNILGSITTMEHDGYSHIEIDFHDTGRGPRVPAMTDHFGFTMAALNENGSVLANRCKGEKSMSTLMYRPFSSWANNSEWSMRFEDEEVKAVALGTAWVAAVTSLNFLRIFSESGLQKNVISLDGPVVTASGFKDELAVVTHASPPLPSNEQMLEFRVFNISSMTQTNSGRLPLSPGSHLAWFGFSEDGRIFSYDTKGVVKVSTEQFGGSWLPIFSSAKVKKPEEKYWVVGVNTSKLICVVCKSPDSYPQVTPKPILTLLDFSLPLASSDLGADHLENEFILKNLQLSQINKQIEERAQLGEDASALDDEAFNLEAALDKCTLKLIGSCCNGDKLVRATELVKLLSLEKSVKGAIKLVTALKLPNLAERFNSILEERLLNETPSTMISPSTSAANASTKAYHSVTNPFTSKERIHTSESAAPPPMPVLSSPSFVKKKKAEVVKSGKMVKEQNQSSKSENIGEVKNVGKFKTGEEKNGELKNSADVYKAQPGPSNPFTKSSKVLEKSSIFDKVGQAEVTNGELKNSSDVNQTQPHPSNPFAAKLSKASEKSSLFDSLKKKNDSIAKK